MVNVITNVDCGNAPKKQAVLDFLVSVANSDFEAALQLLTDDIAIEIIGSGRFNGKKSVKELMFKDGSSSGITGMEVSNILSHGKICAANGLWHFDDGGSVAFNNMYFFESHAPDAKIEKILTYSVVLTNS